MNVTLHKAIIESIEQVIELINVCSTHYNDISPVAESPIGKHVRHIIDHFWAFQEGINTGVIDYNLRHRDTYLERDPQLALQALDDFVTWLNQTPNNNVELTVITEISVSHCESISTPSNSHRELAYLVNHALHHIAYANVLAKSIGLQPADYLGVAPATATYQREQNKTCAQ